MAAATDPYEDDPYRDDVLNALRAQLPGEPPPDDTPPPPPEPPADGTPPDMPVVVPDPVLGPEPPAIPDPDNPPTNPPAPAPAPTVPYTQDPTSAAYRPEDPLRARLTAALTKVLGTDPYAVTADDPSIKPAIDAYYRTRERAMQGERTAAAERANAMGGGGGALDAARERAYQSFGQDVGSYSAQAVLNELTSRKSYLENMAKVSLGLLTADQDAALRMQIAELQAAIDREKLQQQNDQFGRELDYKYDALEA
jgi:hypothetical protein